VNRKKTIVTCAITLLVMSALAAIDLTVEDAVDKAVTGSLSLQSASIDLAISEQEMSHSWNGLLPTVQASGSLSRMNKGTTYMGVTSDPTGVLAFGLSFSWAFTPALITNMKLAEQQYAAGEITWEETIAQLKRDVKKLFYAILLQQKSVALQEQTLANTKERMDQATMLYNQGYATELTMLQAQVGYENLKATVLKQQQAIAQQKRNFAFLLGLDPDEPITLIGEIEPEFKTIDAKKCLASIPSRYDVQSLNAQMTLLDTQKKLIDQKSYIPTISIAASWSPCLSDITGDWKSDNWGDNGSVRIAFGWDLTGMLPFSSTRQSARKIEQNRQKLSVNLALVQANAKLELTKLLDTLSQAEEAITSSERSIALAKKSYEMTEEAYKQGTKELLDVKDSEQQLNQAELGKLQEQYNYLSALLDLEYAMRETI